MPAEELGVNGQLIYLAALESGGSQRLLALHSVTGAVIWDVRCGLIALHAKVHVRVDLLLRELAAINYMLACNCTKSTFDVQHVFGEC